MRAHWTKEQTEDLAHMMSKGLTPKEIAGHRAEFDSVVDSFRVD